MYYSEYLRMIAKNNEDVLNVAESLYLYDCAQGKSNFDGGGLSLNDALDTHANEYVNKAFFIVARIKERDTREGAIQELMQLL